MDGLATGERPPPALRDLVALLHHPDQAREVLDWTVHNRSLLTRQAEWEHSLVALLRGLDGMDRHLIGVKLAEILGEVGVPHADDVLRTLEREQQPGSREYPDEPVPW
ncbi:hypothetical protein LO772_02535 [Yinghuangia sp. ASG 101]|uniref:hypothetical protein n=1 Tax=Yinghuangia sp. ASG 101 TaxID=2896848 RepID=UPI001E3E8D82|nr:hypothetical protein [Yinghuangia sp. ASG 101]UGQ12513.1 hypothetical protein LO772_02535 [Yinghuangia sp. ASG 101]